MLISNATEDFKHRYRDGYFMDNEDILGPQYSTLAEKLRYTYTQKRSCRRKLSKYEIAKIDKFLTSTAILDMYCLIT